jgi:hypothetical protein
MGLLVLLHFAIGFGASHALFHLGLLCLMSSEMDMSRFSYMNLCSFCAELNYKLCLGYLKYLPTQLAHYAYEYLLQQVSLEDLPEGRCDLDSVLKNCLDPDTDRCYIYTSGFGCMTIRSDHWLGTVCVRARPFADDMFHWSIQQVSLSTPVSVYCCLYTEATY